MDVFFSTRSFSWLMRVVPGHLAGFIIQTTDKALIKGIKKFNKGKFAPLLLGCMLALSVGSFMAWPVILYMFGKEIRLQILLDD